MMQRTAPSPIQDRVFTEIAKFLAVTRRRSEHDLYRGRRTARRHYRTWPLLVADLERQRGGDLSVALYNASEKGIAFRAMQSFKPGTILSVKLFWHDPRAYRVPCVVRHCEQTEHGYITGCEFCAEDAALCEQACDVHPRWYDA